MARRDRFDKAEIGRAGTIPLAIAGVLAVLGLFDKGGGCGALALFGVAGV